MTDMTQYGDVFTVRSDANMVEALKHLSSDYILDCMDSEIEIFKSHPFNVSRQPSNIVHTFESDFIASMNEYPTDAAKITNARIETYYYILDHLSAAFGIQINKSENPDQNYVLAYNLYDILVSHINQNMLYFFANYIKNNIDDLYDGCELSQFSKSVDSSFIGLFNDKKTPIVLAYMYKVIKYMAAFDVTFADFVNALPIDSQIKQIIIGNTIDTGVFYKGVICGRFENCYYAASLVSELKSIIGAETQKRKFAIDDYLNK